MNCLEPPTLREVLVIEDRKDMIMRYRTNLSDELLSLKRETGKTLVDITNKDLSNFIHICRIKYNLGKLDALMFYNFYVLNLSLIDKETFNKMIFDIQLILDKKLILMSPQEVLKWLISYRISKLHIQTNIKNINEESNVT